MSSTVVHVNNISAQTTEQQVRDFFSFCGKISNLTVKSTSSAADAPKAATVTFEKDSAAKTALLLDNTQLGPSQVSVSSGASLGELASAAVSSSGAAASDPDSVDQEDKPRSRIAAEYLAHGYVLSDKALQRALELDQQHGISSRFTNALKTYDDKYKVTDKAKATDNQYGVTNKGQQLFASLHSYFQKAADTPTGQKLVDFYSHGQRQVVDIHNEARRLADLKSGNGKTGATGGSSTTEATEANKKTQTTVPGTNKTVCQCGGNDNTCPCEVGKCACSGCGKSGATGGSSSTEATEANRKTQTTVPGTDKTVCQCGGNDGTCPCEVGKCACSGCGKSGVTGEHTATGKADVIGATAGIQPLGDKTA